MIREDQLLNRSEIIPSRTDVLSMAREAGFVVDEKAQQYQPNCIFHTQHMVDELLERFAALVAAAAKAEEREACAKLESEMALSPAHFATMAEWRAYREGVEEYTAAIRARGETTSRGQA